MIGEITTADLESFTKSKLLQGDRETYRNLGAALQEVRNYCNWHVSPSRTETLTLNGPGETILYLPSKHVTAVTQIVEDGVTLDISALSWSEHGEVIKPVVNNSQWNKLWVNKFRSIAVTLTHGFSEPQCEDWRRIVLEVAERMSQIHGLVGVTDLQVGPYRVGAFDPDVNPYHDLMDRIDSKSYVVFEV
jgi:hypothetical protein